MNWRAIVTALLLTSPTAAPGLYFRLDGNRLWLQAQETPIQEILEQFSRAGVEVLCDPKISATVSGKIAGKDLGESLDSLLGSYDYLLTWKMLRGPLGRIPKLKQIRIFIPGEESASQPLFPRKTLFEATRGVTGLSPEFVKDELLVGVRRGVTYEQFRRLLDEIGGMIIEADPVTGVYLIRFPPGTNVEALLQRLARSPLLSHAELNYVMRLPDAAGERAAAPPILPKASRALLATNAIAVLDSGLAPGSEPEKLLLANWDAVAPGRSLEDPAGHGTQMAYLASGLLWPEGLQAPGHLLPLVAIRAFDEEGKTSTFAILQALAFAAQAGARVVNMSWGTETDSTFLHEAMRQASKRGLILIAAAGNRPTGRPVYPAAYPEVVAVAAATAEGQAWSQSNRGAFVDLAAPSLAHLPVGFSAPPGRYVGTSIAAAAVANAVGRYLAQNPAATSSEVLQALEKSLSPPSAEGFGKGILDAAALQRLLNP